MPDLFQCGLEHEEGFGRQAVSGPPVGNGLHGASGDARDGCSATEGVDYRGRGAELGCRHDFRILHGACMAQVASSPEWRQTVHYGTVAPMLIRGNDPHSLAAVAERMKLTRLALGLSQAAIGRLAGIEPQAWNNNERARGRISLDQAIKLCIATGVSLDWIYRGEMRGLPHELAVKIQEQIAAPEKAKPGSRKRA